jgi:hypothetical protein
MSWPRLADLPLLVCCYSRPAAGLGDDEAGCVVDRLTEANLE